MLNNKKITTLKLLVVVDKNINDVVLESDKEVPSPVDHILPNLSTMTCPSCVAPRAWLSFIELDKAVVLV